MKNTKLILRATAQGCKTVADLARYLRERDDRDTFSRFGSIGRNSGRFSQIPEGLRDIEPARHRG